MNQFEYVTAVTGYVHCSCIGCFDTTVATSNGSLCCLCEDAGCEDYDYCQQEESC